MKLKLDENLSRHLKPVLIGLGHDVLTAADENLLSHPDTKIAQAAKDEQRMFLTLDVEFADLRKYPPGSHPGVIPSRTLSQH
jgi:predicted nuclease of predicted toxin-antitoxin system